MSDESWIQRVTSLNQWQRNGERAPHKPLLLLYAIGRLQRTGSSSMSFAVAESDLRHLIEEYGPPRPAHPEYPFHHLVNDGLWEVRTPAGPGSPGTRLSDLRAGAVGELAPDFARAIEGEPSLFAEVVRAILDTNFPGTLHDDVLSSVGINLEPSELQQARPKSVRRRDPAFREMVLTAYEYQCAVCGYDGQLFREAVGLEAAHVRWWAADGPDELSNALALCSLHHKLFDRGAIGATLNHEVMVSSHFIGRSEAADTVVLSLVGRPLVMPQSGQPQPHPTQIAWHHKEVFRTPERQLVR